jgi:phycoerythrin-associated linker protein
MNINEFVQNSLGRWRSQRSGHNLAFQHFEEVLSTIDITTVAAEDAAVIELCKLSNIEQERATSPFKMEWEGQSDWDDDETMSGSCILVPVPDLNNPNAGQLLRSQGYAETIPAIGRYRITEENTFFLETTYDRAAAEERIWFGTPNLRFRVSLIKTSDGQGILTASFASEIRSVVTPSE